MVDYDRLTSRVNTRIWDSSVERDPAKPASPDKIRQTSQQ